MAYEGFEEICGDVDPEGRVMSARPPSTAENAVRTMRALGQAPLPEDVIMALLHQDDAEARVLEVKARAIRESAVRTAREEGLSWEKIASCLEMGPMAVQAAYESEP